MDNGLFFCDTYYHLLITLIKCIKNKGKNDLVIATSLGSYQLYEDNDLLGRLKDSHIFKNIYFFDYRKKYLNVNNSKLKLIKYFKLLSSIKKEKKIILNSYSNIYLFHDTSLYGKYINYMKKTYILLEDGTDCFKNNLSVFNNCNKFINYIRNMFGFSVMGQSKYIKYIEVNDTEGINISNQTIKKNSKEEMFKKLTDKEIVEIKSIFLNDMKLIDFNNSTVIISQPFFIDGALKTQENQDDLHRYIIDNYTKCDDNVIVKMHPRETSKYNFNRKNVTIIDKNFPIELISFNENIKIKKVITISSTAVELLKNVEEKVVLGWDFLREYKERCERIYGESKQ